MRILRIIFIFIFVIIGIYLLASLFIPKKYKVEKTLTLNAPVDIVFEQIASFKNWEKWSPQKEKDPDVKSLFGLDNKKAGSYWLWKGKKAGEGRITLTEIDPQNQVSYHYSSQKPFITESDGYIKLEPDANQTKVTWAMEGTFPFYLRVMNLMMERRYGPDFDKGLSLLQKIAEGESKILQNEYFGYRIKETRFDGYKIAYVRKAILIDELDEFFTKNNAKVKTEVTNCEFKINGAPIALFYRWDFENGVATVAAALPVEGDSTLGNDVGLMQLQPQKALLLNYYGGYKSMKNAYTALDNYIRNKKLSMVKPTLEEYIIGPKQQTDSAKWQTRIWYLLDN